MARKPIVQRISLDGGKEIEKQLKALGDAGEKAFRQIQTAALKVKWEQFGTSLGKFNTALGNTTRRMGLLVRAFGVLNLAAVGAAGAIFLNTKNAAAYADAIGKAAQKTGLQTDAFQKLAFAAEMSDVSQESFVSSMTKLNRSIITAAGKAAKGAKQLTASLGTIDDEFDESAANINDTGVKMITDTGELVSEFGGEIDKAGKKAGAAGMSAATAFRQLGVVVKDANNKLRPTEDIMADLADRFAAMPDGARKTALAMALFGKAGADMIPFLNEGSAAIRKLGKDLEENGLVLTDAQIKAGDDLGDALDNLNGAMKGVRTQIGLMFAPVFTDLAKDFRDVVNQNRVAIVEFVRSIAVSGIGILHDFFNALRGKGEVERPWVQEWTDNILTFGEAVVTVVNNVILPLFRLIRAGAQLVADGINAIFDTDISGTEILITAGLLEFLGVLKLVPAAIGLVTTAVGLLADGLLFLLANPLVLVAAGLIAAAILAIVYWDEIKAAAADAWEWIKAGAAETWPALVAVFEGGKSEILRIFTDIKDGIVGIWTDMIRELSGLIGTLMDNIGKAFAALKRLIATATSAPTGALAGAQTSKARGGYIRGPGTGTSDSILARLSTGEFVIRAAAVRKFGASFFAQLNALRMPAFSPGGLVRGLERSMAQMMPIPRYAAGGLAMAPAGGISGRPVNLSFPGGESFALIAPENVAEKLARFASSQALRSAGRKPGWYR